MEKEFIDVLTAQNNLTSAAKLAHWNVDGTDFYPFHLLFEKIYGISDSKIDKVAEQARGTGVEIPAKIFTEVPEVEWSTPAELAEELCSLVKDLKEALGKLHEKADEKSEYGLLNVLEDIMSDCNTMCYLLGSVNKKFS